MPQLWHRRRGSALLAARRRIGASAEALWPTTRHRRSARHARAAPQGDDGRRVGRAAAERAARHCWRSRCWPTAPSSIIAARFTTGPCMRRSLAAALTLAPALHGIADRRAAAHRRPRRDLCRWPAATGLAGTGFHSYNVTKRPGGLSWQNLFYAAPLGAPMALMLAGLLGCRGRACARHPRDGRRAASASRPVAIWPR